MPLSFISMLLLIVSSLDGLQRAVNINHRRHQCEHIRPLEQNLKQVEIVSIELRQYKSTSSSSASSSSAAAAPAAAADDDAAADAADAADDDDDLLYSTCVVFGVVMRKTQTYIHVVVV